MFELSRQEKKIKSQMMAEMRLKQRWQWIDWEFDYLKPKLAEFKAKAQLPELPSCKIVEIVEDESAVKTVDGEPNA